MLVFPNCKINLGLNILQKREDGFHNIETVFYPINWNDALEVIENSDSKLPFNLGISGIKINGNLESNLIYKAWQMISEKRKLPAIEVHLHKKIPMGAGLGGGSSDAAFFIELLNKKFELKLTEKERLAIASQLGSDCAFFIHNQPLLAQEKGNVFSQVKLDLSNFFILIIYPNIHSNTKEAYEGITPNLSKNNLKNIIEKEPIINWKNTLINDFETSIFKRYPAIGELKKSLYKQGALYAAMSGSGSAVFGIFEKEPAIDFDANYLHCLQKPKSNIL